MEKRVLLIDDEKPTLNMFRLMLAAYGYQVLTAEGGDTGFDIFAAERPPLVITDIKMPGMDGIELLKRVKDLDHRTEVIVVTGHGDMDLAIEALNLDATDFINKPVHRQALELALKRAEERIALARGKEEEISLQDRETAAVISLKGNINSHSEPFLFAAYDKALDLGRPLLVLHFDDSASVNGAGIAILTQLLLRARDKGRRLAISGVSENFRKVFEIVGITKLVKLHDSVEEAMADLH
ncbi:MAG TPA: hypothetical protein DDW80_01465 [Desulfovibrio sp.]|jgi:anti-anti-sigma factor|nr:hypothetical protein [Desulfovibrio sp.]